jgi:hypothetical protein
MRRPEIEAAKHLVKTSAQTSAKEGSGRPAHRIELRIRCGKELQHLPFFKLTARRRLAICPGSDLHAGSLELE